MLLNKVSSQTCPSLHQALAFTDPLPLGIDLEEEVSSSKIKLENVFLRGRMAFCTIRCRNIAFAKVVGVRVSFDNWASHQDIEGDFLSSAFDSKSDKFIVSLDSLH